MDGFKNYSLLADMIVSGAKTIEIRRFPTNKRGTVAVLDFEKKVIVGTVDISDCKEYKTDEEYNKDFKKHKYSVNRPYEKTFGWILTNPVKFDVPKKYKDKPGARVWLKI